MADFDDDLLDELIAESKEHLEAIEPDLMGFEANPEAVDPEAVNRVFRAVHSIKGGFGFFSLNHITELAHSMENVMGLIRDGELTVRSAIVDVLLAGIDKLLALIDDVHASESIPIDEEMARLAEILGAEQQESSVPRGKDNAVVAAGTGGPSDFLEAMEILRTPGSDELADEATNRLGELLRLMCDQVSENGKAIAEDILADYDAVVKAVGLDGLLRAALTEKLEGLLPFLQNQPAEEKIAPSDRKSIPSGREQAVQSLRVRVDLLDSLMNLAGELVLSRNRIKRTLADKLSSGMAAGPQLDRLEKQLAASRRRLDAMARASGNGHAQALSGVVAREFDSIDSLLHRLLESSLSDFPGMSGAAQHLDGVTGELQDQIMATRMQLVGSVFSKFPRVIRDMSRKMGKEMELLIQGEDVELDKSVIEAMGDPLTHLIRNSADHGIETPEVRKAAGKPSQGTIELIARHEGGQVVVEIIDDGAGIDLDKIKKKAEERNLLTAKDAAELTEREVLRLIFAPGFSTAEQVSDVSGRGVGMDVVRSNIERIGGTVEIESTLGQGSCITLRLPLTLAIMPALVVRNEERDFAVPQVDIEELVRIRAKDAARRIESIHGRPVVRLRERVLPLVCLNDVLGIEATYVDSTGKRKPERRKRLLDRRAVEIVPDTSVREGGAAGTPADLNTEQRTGNAGRRRNRQSAFSIVVLRVGSNRYGLVVDTLRDSEEIVIKPLPEYLKKCRAYAGTTIMGDGRIAMILDAAGMAEVSQLHFGGDLEKAKSAQSDNYIRESMQERQSLLIFRNGTTERFAINLAMIKRIEKAERSAIEWVNDKEYLKYESSSLRVLRLHDFLPVGSPEQDSDEILVIVPKLVRHPMGIIVSAVEDVLETSAPLDRETISGTGILGSLVENGMLIICLDVYGLLEAAEPGTYGTGSIEVVRGKRVLLAEDTAFFRSVASDYLRDMGCDVETAVDGQEAWEKLSNSRFDILVTDIQMPIVDGLELARRVRTSPQHKGMPILALTSLTNEKDRLRILDSGIDAYEAKLDKESLRNTLETLASRERQGG